MKKLYLVNFTQKYVQYSNKTIVVQAEKEPTIEEIEEELTSFEPLVILNMEEVNEKDVRYKDYHWVYM